MATPKLTKHLLPGSLGDILLDVRAANAQTASPAVLILPGFKGFKDWGMFPPLAERLARAGFTTVTINVSGSGVDDAGNFSYPERFGHNTFSAEVADVRTVLDALATGRLGVAPPSSIGLVGHSRGGGVAVLVAADDPRVCALVTWAAVGSVERWPRSEWAAWRNEGRRDVVNTRTGQVLPLYPDVIDDIDRNGAALDIDAAATRVAAPWLIIHGTADEAVDAREARALAAASPRGTTRLQLIEGAGHTFGAKHPWAGSTPDLEGAVGETVAWMGRYL
jgi:pimeloyl-ACP methyl ester carboxylesterase